MNYKCFHHVSNAPPADQTTVFAQHEAKLYVQKASWRLEEDSARLHHQMSPDYQGLLTVLILKLPL